MALSLGKGLPLGNVELHYSLVSGESAWSLKKRMACIWSAIQLVFSTIDRVFYEYQYVEYAIPSHQDVTT
jgi:hypothetical protein